MKCYHWSNALPAQFWQCSGEMFLPFVWITEGSWAKSVWLEDRGILGECVKDRIPPSAVNPTFLTQLITTQLQPMIEQSQFQHFLIPSDPALSLLPPDLVQEEHKVAFSPSPRDELPTLSPNLSKKQSRRLSTDTPRSRKSKVEEPCNPNQKFGHWALEENKRYHWFLEIHNNHFLNKHMRRMDKIFKTMATFVGTREAQQCRSHHQKMEKKYHSIAKILLSLRRQHYDSEVEVGLREDLERNSIEMVDDILSAETLINLSQNVNIISEREIMMPPSPLSLEEGTNEAMEEQEKKDCVQYDQEEDGLKLFALNPEAHGMDIVDELFGDIAPHFNFQMI